MDTLQRARRHDLRAVGDELEAGQVARTRSLRERRDGTVASDALAALQTAAAGTEKVLPRIRACVEASVTLGEIAGALRVVWGEHRP